MGRILFFASLIFFPLNSSAEKITSLAADQVSVTIYRAESFNRFDLSDLEAEAAGIALITETRTIDLPAGDSVISFLDVAQSIVSQSARIESLDAELDEINFDYQLISPGDIIANSIGQEVSIIRTQHLTGISTKQVARLISGPSGILLNINGVVEALGCSGENEKIIFTDIPVNLQEKPTLSAHVHSQHSGTRKITLTYLATGFDWITHYVANINPDGKTLDLTAWITLVNQQSTAFKNAKVEVVAGDISRDEDTEPVNISYTQKNSACWNTSPENTKRTLRTLSKFGVSDDGYGDAVEEVIVTGIKSSIATASELGDYKLYSLPNSTDILSNQIKQVKMLEISNVSFEKIYQFEFTSDVFDHNADKDNSYSANQVMAAAPTIRLLNKKSKGLGIPLPAGDFSVIENATKKQLTTLIGEGSAQDTPIGLPLDIKLGTSQDIDIQQKSLRNYSVQRGDINRNFEDLQFTVTNYKSEKIVLEIKPFMDDYPSIKVTKESKKHAMKNGAPVWTMEIPPGKQSILHCTIENMY